MDKIIQNHIKKVEESIIDYQNISNLFTSQFSKSPKKSRLTERMQELNIPGVSIAVITKNKIEWLKQYGIIDNRTNKKVTQKTMFQAASTSKLITALIILHFVEKEILKLDEEVNNYLHSWKLPENTERARVLWVLFTHITMRGE